MDDLNTTTRFYAGEASVIVIGAGHAGIEAALACARMGEDTILFTLQLDAVANMPCNPSIGGSGKGHLVFEIDALGGEMGRASDEVCTQSRMLNTSKGPAVHSLRQQADRRAYHHVMKRIIENSSNLRLIQAEITAVEKNDDGYVVTTRYGAQYPCKACIICTGTYLKSNIVVGDVSIQSGPDNQRGADFLTESLIDMGVSIRRFKTGTPPRIHKDSIDYSKTEVQYGDEEPCAFSKRTPEGAFPPGEQLPCHVIYTNEETHKIIRDNIDRSPLYSGKIKSTGPRYCPSIEDKIMRFPDKTRHQLFLEAMGFDTKEIYVQGLSSSLPEDVQMKVIHSIAGLENAQVMRTAYAIEYDCADPTQLYPTLEFKELPGLYGAGQFNGTSGYEEAAAQGLIAGMNAALKIQGKEQVVLTRDSSYIGTLIDDLVTKGTNEPYRIMTSRCEYRMLLRQDNADRRLTDIAKYAGLITDEEYESRIKLFKMIDDEINRAETTFLSPNGELKSILENAGSTPVTTGISVGELIRRPELNYDILRDVDKTRPELPREIQKRAEIEIKYAGYIKREKKEAEAFKRIEAKLLPADIDYSDIRGLKTEAAQKLSKMRPVSLGQASRISGISPADISVLVIYLSQKYPQKNFE
ncbi:MAG: tRNA uridine-5-carboxymethylaminomethyl(34) synthesis enzyme MnmG [Ruminococcaceae bacterium]|nr:tRNA uridine-5-carboxymethylaminomethyl(34) synthesis enzyme MnmG [Oscillospiraceae bacterium]